MRTLIQFVLQRRFSLFLRALSVAPVGLILLFSAGTALAAPSSAAPTALTSFSSASGQAIAAKGVTIQAYQQVSGNQSLGPLGGPPQPTCDKNTDPNGCASQLTTKLGTTAKAIFQVGIWVAVVVAVLVVVWTTPSGIFAAANNNSKVLSQVVIRLGLIAALILLAINSWTILQWFLGDQGNNITSPTFPGIGN